ncbi:hypothetical protein TNCT_590181 [Trichonephila clavata]|uniref:Uncharacterized protein n=1 Tax=Trichonephila clavata TaxID=2740835 RepID=A0A8X6HJD5_TRICU|nr:hypothetical protein TNCT_590181 [Trichonephila clavata]
MRRTAQDKRKSRNVQKYRSSSLYSSSSPVNCVSSWTANGNRSSFLEKQISSYQLRRQKSHAPDVIAQTTNIVVSSQLLVTQLLPHRLQDYFHWKTQIKTT